MHESVEKIENIFGKRVCSCMGEYNHLPLNGRVIHKWITYENMWITLPLTIIIIYEHIEIPTITKDKVIHI